MGSLDLRQEQKNIVTRVNSTGKGKNIFLWILQVAAAGMFLLAGFFKLTGAEQMVQLFNVIGIGQWFRYVTGGLEVLGAIGLLVPALTGIGALGLAGVMVGAIATHLFILGDSPAMPLILFITVGVIAWGRKERIISLLDKILTEKL